MKKLMSLLAAAGCIGLAAQASAASFPASIVGGPWNWSANQSVVQVSITSQGTTGTCVQILGTMTVPNSSNVADVQGYYCPATGRISMLRKDHASQATYQVWSGQVSAQPTLSAAYAGGTFLSIGSGPSAGEFQFTGPFHLD